MRTLIAVALGCTVLFSTTVFADNSKPSTVQGINANSEPGPAIKVSWNRASDNIGVDGYNIYRNNLWYATVSNTTSFIDTQISTGTEYRYAVVAFDRARNYSFMSSVASATNYAAQANPVSPSAGRPATPQNLNATVLDSSSVRLTWNPPAGGAEGYNLYRNGRYFTTVRGRNEHTETGLSSNQNHDFQIAAFRGSEFSVTSPKASVNLAGENNSPSSLPTAPTAPPAIGTGKPSAPTNVRAAVLDSSSVKLFWNTPAGGAEGYNLYINGRYDTTVRGRNDRTLFGLDSGRTHSFHVVAFRNGQYSTNSSTVNASINAVVWAPPPPDAASSNGAVPVGYSLVFSDEFNGWDFNSTKWNTRYLWGPNFIINNEEQYYVDTLNDRNFGSTPFKFSGDKLTIEATRTPDWLKGKAAGKNYLSGAMTTYNKFAMTYGYVEIRAKLPAGRGLWPAFWLLHSSNDGRRPEIDVMEMLGGNPRLVYQTYHYYDNGTLRSTPSFQAPGPDYSSDFHTFGMLWEPNRIIWYVNGQETNRYESEAVSNESMYLLMNLALGGTWADSPDGSTPFPARYEIDYVRAYQRR